MKATLAVSGVIKEKNMSLSFKVSAKLKTKHLIVLKNNKTLDKVQTKHCEKY